MNLENLRRNTAMLVWMATVGEKPAFDATSIRYEGQRVSDMTDLQCLLVASKVHVNPAEAVGP